jgi:hypothetical protein
MWTAAIVMTHELAYDPSQMPLVEGDQEVEALAANRPDEPLAVRVRLGRPDRRF